MNKDDKGDICKVCERKFYIKEILSADHAKIIEMTLNLHGENGRSTLIEGKQTEIEELRKLSTKMTKIFKKDKNAIEICQQKF